MWRQRYNFNYLRYFTGNPSLESEAKRITPIPKHEFNLERIAELEIKEVAEIFLLIKDEEFLQKNCGHEFKKMLSITKNIENNL